MGPVFQHLRTLFPELPHPCVDSERLWTFDVSLKTLGPAFYNKILPAQPILNVEYSVLCNQLRQDFLEPKLENKKQIVERLRTALLFCELLEYIHVHYLVVPREVVRLRKQQELFRTLLNELAGFTFVSDVTKKTAVDVDLSMSQRIRDTTIQANWYRICINRSKRVVDLFHLVVTDSPAFNNIMVYVGKYGNPFLAYFGLLFHLPRLLSNSFLLVKHTIPGAWMSEKERSLNWTVRFGCQVQRRFFELGNDAVWTTVSAVNLFLLVGALASGAVYLSAIAFAFDMINAAVRAYIELKRLYKLRNEYTDMLAKEENPERQKAIQNHLQHLEERIRFEQYRFSLHVTGTTLIFLAMSMALPIFALNPTVVLASAIFLLLLWAITYALTQKLDDHRPKETIEVDGSVSKLGLFAPKKQASDTKNSPSRGLSDGISDMEVEGVTTSTPLFP
jgi:hypothetical protein